MSNIKNGKGYFKEEGVKYIIVASVHKRLWSVSLSVFDGVAGQPTKYIYVAGSK